jgi:hypothetical protein
MSDALAGLRLRGGELAALAAADDRAAGRLDDPVPHSVFAHTGDGRGRWGFVYILGPRDQGRTLEEIEAEFRGVQVATSRVH